MENECGHGKSRNSTNRSYGVFSQKDNHFRSLTIKLKRYKIKYLRLMFEF